MRVRIDVGTRVFRSQEWGRTVEPMECTLETENLAPTNMAWAGDEEPGFMYPVRHERGYVMWAQAEGLTALDEEAGAWMAERRLA